MLCLPEKFIKFSGFRHTPVKNDGFPITLHHTGWLSSCSQSYRKVLLYSITQDIFSTIAIKSVNLSQISEGTLKTETSNKKLKKKC